MPKIILATFVLAFSYLILLFINSIEDIDVCDHVIACCNSPLVD